MNLIYVIRCLDIEFEPAEDECVRIVPVDESEVPTITLNYDNEC